MSTAAPKTTNLYELASQIDSTQNLSELWAEEYLAGDQQANDLIKQWFNEAEQQANHLPEQWAEEFSDLNLHEQGDEAKIGAEYVSNTNFRFSMSSPHK